MKPDRTNYEIWLVDYLDGSLSMEMEAELLLFLDENPDIKEELSEIMSLRIAPAEGNFKYKDSLKKSLNDLSDSQFEVLCVAASENDLTEGQKSEFQEIITGSPVRRAVAEEIKRIKLHPPEVTFRYKNRLKKVTLSQRIYRYSVITLSAAAAILLVITVARKPVAPLPVTRFSASITDTVTVERIPVKSAVPPESKEAVPPEPVYSSESSQLPNSEIDSAASEDRETMIIARVIDSAAYIPAPGTAEIAKIDFREEVFSGVVLAENSLVALKLEPVITDNAEKSPPIAKFFREKILKSDTPGKGPLRAYEIADAGINGLNRLFGWHVAIQKNIDEKGEVTSVYFNSKLIKFNAPVKKSESSE